MGRILRVGLDLDGVLYNFGDSCRRYLESIGKGHLWKSGPTPEPYWEWYKDWGWTGAEFVQFCNDGADAGYIFTGPVRDNAVAAVEKIKDLGHQIIVITDRQFGSTPKVSHDNTIDWWNTHFPAFDEIHFSADKTIAPTDTFVEDKLENYDALISNGTPTWLINRAWNKADDARNRIDCVSDYADAIEVITKRGYADLTFS